jgi:predicted phosphodiesterase
MKIGVMSDTHNDTGGALPYIIAEFKKRGVEGVIHCGDIIPQHVSRELFGNLPVICAIVKGQPDDPCFNEKCPDGWRFTRSDNRVVRLFDGGELVYVGHKRHMDFLTGTEEKFNETLTNLRMEFDGLRMVFGGHLHFQTFMHGNLVNFINPGAVEPEGSIGWGYEFTIVDTENREVVFSRILPTPDDRQPWSIGVISDSLDVTHRDSTYWQKLAHEFRQRGVTNVIHCGNIAVSDIGHPDLTDGFTVHYAIRDNQKKEYAELKKTGKIPGNWKVISEENLDKGAEVVINGYHFFVQLDLGFDFMTISEHNMDSRAMKIRRENPETEFVLCGFTREALLVEGQQVITINPGNTNADRGFVVICLPRREITFGHVPYDPLPKLPNKSAKK